MKVVCLESKLLKVFMQHNTVTIAVDFDDTIFDYKNTGLQIEPIITIIKQAIKVLNAEIFLFTCREGKELEFAVKHCADLGIPLCGVNQSPHNPDTKSKPFYNLLLDDKACLYDCANVLGRVIKEVLEINNDKTK